MYGHFCCFQSGLRIRMEDLKKSVVKASAAVEEEKRKNVELLQTIFPADIAKKLWRSELSLFIRPSKTGRIMLSPVAGGRAVSLILCPEHISKTMLATVMKLHGYIDLIKAECSAQEP